jgi:hypothetical protein
MGKFFDDDRELEWYAFDDHGDDPSRAPRYAPHMASVMFEPFVKNGPSSKLHVRSYGGNPFNSVYEGTTHTPFTGLDHGGRG